MTTPARSENSIFAKAIAGISGSILTNTLLTPLDVLKIRQQNGESLSAGTSSPSLLQRLKPCTGCGHFNRNKGGLLDRVLCAVSRLSTTTTTTTTTTTNPINITKAIKSTCTSTHINNNPHPTPSLCGLCGNHQHTHHTHSIWERCTPSKKNYTTRAPMMQLSTTMDTSMYGTLKTIIKQEGYPALWDGLRPALLLSSINVVLYMIAYDELSKDILPNRLGWNTSISTIVAGGASRALAGLVVSPLELIRTQQQASTTLAKKGMLNGMKNIVQKDGVLSLWRGYSATMWRDVPFSIAYWYGFEALKRTIENPSNNIPIRDNLFLTSFASGAGSGMLAAFLTTPFDVIKTRRQVVTAGTTEARTGRLLLDIVQSEGVTKLFSGVVPRVVKVAPACGMLIGTYSMVQEWVAGFGM